MKKRRNPQPSLLSSTCKKGGTTTKNKNGEIDENQLDEIPERQCDQNFTAFDPNITASIKKTEETIQNLEIFFAQSLLTQAKRGRQLVALLRTIKK